MHKRDDKSIHFLFPLVPYQPFSCQRFFFPFIFFILVSFLHFFIYSFNIFSLLMSQQNEILYEIDHFKSTYRLVTWEEVAQVSQTQAHSMGKGLRRVLWSKGKSSREIDYKNFSLQLSFEPIWMWRRTLNDDEFCSCFIFITMTDLNDDTWYVETAFFHSTTPCINLSINFLVSIWHKIDKIFRIITKEGLKGKKDGR